MQRLILASQSPRRKELLSTLQLSFDVMPSGTEEVLDDRLSPEELVMALAAQKAADIARNHRDAFVLGADTIVLFEGKVLGKPKDKEEAISTISMLSGNTHDVLTGVAIFYQDQKSIFFEKTEVTFWPLTEEEIAKYVESGEPMDKAGSYGIQGLGSALVQKINGDYFAVVGLPVSRTIRELEKLGYKRP